MMDHMGFAVSDIARSIAFYEPALAPLGIVRLMARGGTDEAPEQVGFGSGFKPFFWLFAGARVEGYLHVAFAADSPEMVRAFHDAALKAGGRDNGAPGPRPIYHAGYYGAFVLDPDGINVEAVHHDLSGFG